MKTCHDCRKTKPLKDFYNAKKSRDGKQVYCKPCANIRSKQFYKNNLKKITTVQRNYQYLKLYGITTEQYEELLKEQNNKCAICNIKVRHLKYKLHVDHDHKYTDSVRGLLCGDCNKGLGYFKDNPEFLRAAADYIEEHQV